jgi:hypothetical protein
MSADLILALKLDVLKKLDALVLLRRAPGWKSIFEDTSGVCDGHSGDSEGILFEMGRWKLIAGGVFEPWERAFRARRRFRRPAACAARWGRADFLPFVVFDLP